ncbi:hypothetical protein QQ045_032245 [Rhodiola kirilowii]
MVNTHKKAKNAVKASPEPKGEKKKSSDDVASVVPMMDLNSQRRSFVPLDLDGGSADRVTKKASGGDLEAKVEALLNVEKQARNSGDVAGTKKAATDILQLCFEAGAWKTLNDQIIVLSKRRRQLKQQGQ